MTGNDGLLALLGILNELDFAHIEHWCGLHGTMDLLEKARAVAGG